ncbi:MAG TPA: hypothetical protein VM096_07740 [Vicinamibacterales bacterium]|nr:hypothetical protein [Vicinamibacterales bacterium]
MHERNARIALASALFVYVLAMRTYDVATTFLMLGEQTRDWAIALGGITDLPLLGAPSTAGGRGLGPAYYWALWLGRVTIGPFMDNLPHAGGVTVALLQSTADAFLFFALSRRVHWALALAMCLVIGSAPFDIAISQVIWNPPVAAAFIKMATASALMIRPPEPGSTKRHSREVGLTAAFAWMAVQCHLSGLFVAAPLLAALVLQPLLYVRPQVYEHETAADQRRRGKRDAARSLAIVVGVVLVLQIPFLLARITEPATPAGPASLISGLIHPQVFRPWVAYDTVTGITGNLLWPLPDTFKFAMPILIAVGIVAIVYRRDAIVIAISAGAIAMATALFTTSTRSYDGYWFLTLTTALTLTAGMVVAAIPSRVAVTWIGVLLLMFVAWRQPARIKDSTRFFKYPQYAPMLKGSREAAMRAPVLRDIITDFEVHPTMDRQFIYKILGGRIESSAIWTAVISKDGSVRLK